jgi:poly-gamma-glutamate synthesis protein (capsule biosynthesis protein)
VERNDNPDTKGATEVTAGTFRCFSETELARLCEAIEEADAQADLTIVYIHWGTENTDELHWAQEWQAPKLVEAGADLIVGDHPHCLQPIDYIDGVPVFYSLGNLWFNSKTLDTGLLKTVLDEEGNLTCQFLPAKQHDCRTDLMTGDEKQRILDYLQCISPDVTIDSEGYVRDEPYSGPEIDYDSVQRLPVQTQPDAQTDAQTDAQSQAQTEIP